MLCMHGQCMVTCHAAKLCFLLTCTSVGSLMLSSFSASNSSGLKPSDWKVSGCGAAGSLTDADAPVDTGGAEAAVTTRNDGERRYRLPLDVAKRRGRMVSTLDATKPLKAWHRQAREPVPLHKPPRAELASILSVLRITMLQRPCTRANNGCTCADGAQYKCAHWIRLGTNPCQHQQLSLRNI